jgi:hypothetical protein
MEQDLLLRSQESGTVHYLEPHKRIPRPQIISW